MILSGKKTLVGLAFEGKRMKAVSLRRSGGEVKVRRLAQTALSLDPLTSEPELMAREIRNHLSAAGIADKACLVCVPLEWIFTHQTDLPELSEADAASYLSVQSERAFPFGPEDLSVAVSRYQAPARGLQVMLAALPLHHVNRLREVLKMAGLRLDSITVGIASLGDPADSGGMVALLLRESGADLGVWAGGGLAALRPLDEEAAEAGAEGGAWDAALIARQIRVTLGNLPQGLADTIRTVRVFDAGGLAGFPLSELKEALGAMGLQVELGKAAASPVRVGTGGDKDSAWVLAGMAAGRLLGRRAELEFLPPRSSRFKRLAGQVSARRAVWLGAAGAVVAVCVALAFLAQYSRLSKLEKEWAVIEPQVRKVEALQENVRTFRPWFDDSVQSLRIGTMLASAFPEEGSVWVKTFGIKDLSKVTFSGNARANRDLLKMLDTLRKTSGIEDVQVLLVRGGSPVQFSVSFRWNGGGSHGL